MGNIIQQSFCLRYTVQQIKKSNRKKKQKKEQLLHQLTLEEWAKVNSNDTKYLIIQYQKTKDKKILDKLVKENFKLIHYTINQFGLKANKNVEYDDLVQEGYIGLIKAINNFNPNKDTLFSTYVVNYIKGYVVNYVKLNSNGSLAVSLHGMNLLNKYKQNNSDIKDKELKTSLKTISQTPIFLDAPLDNGNSNDNSCSQELVTTEPNVFKDVDFQMTWEKISLDLSEREKIIAEYYIQGYKWVDISKKLDIKPQTVRVTGIRAFKKLKNQYGSELKKLLI